MGESKPCKKKGRNASRCGKYYSEGRYLNNVLKRRKRHVLAQPNDKAAKACLYKFAEDRGGPILLHKVKAALEVS